MTNQAAKTESNDPRRVAFAIGAYPPSIGGAQSYAQRLAHELAAQGQDVTVFTQWRTTRTDFVAAATQTGSLPPRRECDGPVSVQEIGLVGEQRRDQLMRRAYLPLRSTAASYFAGRMEPLQGDFDSVHLIRVGREHLGLAAQRLAQAQQVPLILTALHHPRWSRWWWPDPVWRRLYRQADLVIALTQVEAELLADLGVAPERIEVLGVGPHLVSEQERPTGVSARSRFVLFLGQQYPYKRLDLAIDAFDAIATTHPDLRLVVAGPPHPVGSQSLESARNHDRIDVLGAVSETQKSWLLTHAAALVFPSEQESFGGIIVEAAVSRCPVVAGANRQVSEVVSALDWGTTTDGSGAELATAIDAVLKAPPSEAEGNRAAQQATARYSWSALAGQYDHRVSGLVVAR